MLPVKLCLGTVWGPLVNKSWDCAWVCMLSSVGWVSVCQYLMLFLSRHHLAFGNLSQALLSQIYEK